MNSFSKKLALSILAFCLPIFVGAQTFEVSSVDWTTTQASDTSINLSGSLVGNITSSVIYTQLEYGFGGFGISGDPFADITLPIYHYPTQQSLMHPVNSPGYNFQFSISGLQPSTLYYFDLFEATDISGNNQINIAGGSDINFVSTAPPANPQVNVNAVSSTEISIEGRFVTSGGAPLANFPLEIFLLSNPSDDSSVVGNTVSTNTASFDPLNGVGYFSANYSGLTPGETYHVKIENSFSGLNMLVPYISVTLPTTNPTNTNPNNGTGTVTVNTTNLFNTGASSTGLVACSGAECDFNALITTIDNVVNFLIFVIGFPIAAIIFAWAGILMITSGGSTSKRDQAKKLAGRVVVGLILALLSWIIIKTLLTVFGYSGLLLGIFGI